MEKTGTTSIQQFLARNRAALAAQPIHVPEFLGATNHRWAAYMAEDVERVDGFSRQLGLAESAGCGPRGRRRSAPGWGTRCGVSPGPPG